MSDPFVTALLDSKRAVRRMAEYLNDKGYPVTIMPTFIRPNVEARNEYLDNGDMYVGRRIEVKHRNIDFTGRDDYPYKQFVIERKAKHDTAKPAPVAYYIVNRTLTHFGRVMVSTQTQWIVKPMNDNRPGRSATDDMYFCALSLVEFNSFT